MNTDTLINNQMYSVLNLKYSEISFEKLCQPDSYTKNSEPSPKSTRN